MIEISLALDWRLLVAVLAGLFGAAIGYNAYVDSLNGNHKGATAWLVVWGVVITLAGAALLIGIVQALIVAACFCASGLPMILGERRRHERNLKAQAEENQKLNNEWFYSLSGWSAGISFAF